MSTKKPNLASDNRGTTLVEMIVSFILIALFMVAATKVIANTVAIYYQAKGIATGMQVASIVNTKITSVIEGALPSPLDSKGSGTMASLVYGEDWIELTDHTGSHVKISAVDPDTHLPGTKQYLNIYYYPTTESDPLGGGQTDPGINWSFDKKLYMGYYIRELRFEPAGTEYKQNVIKMTLVLDSMRYGEYVTTSYIKCYNFKDDDLDMIVVMH